MNTYSIGSDSPRWWWPSAAAGAVGAAAIAAILVLPANSFSPPGGTTPQNPRAPASDLWFSRVDPAVDRQCFALPARRTAPLDNPTCGRRVTQTWSGVGGKRPRLDVRP